MTYLRLERESWPEPGLLTHVRDTLHLPNETTQSLAGDTLHLPTYTKAQKTSDASLKYLFLSRA